MQRIRFLPDGRDLVLDFTTRGGRPQQQCVDLATWSFHDGFNPWEGAYFGGFCHRGFCARLVGLDGQNVLWVRHPMPKDQERFFDWEIRVTDIQGNVVRDWRKLPNRVARRIDDRLDARIVPGADGLVIVNPFGASISWYDWKSDQLWSFARPHRKHDQVEYYATHPGRISLIYRESNSDLTIKVWSAPPGQSE